MLFNRNQQEVLCHQVTIYETWLHYFTTEFNCQSGAQNVAARNEIHRVMCGVNDNSSFQIYCYILRQYDASSLEMLFLIQLPSMYPVLLRRYPNIKKISDFFLRVFYRCNGSSYEREYRTYLAMKIFHSKKKCENEVNAFYVRLSGSMPEFQEVACKIFHTSFSLLSQ